MKKQITALITYLKGVDNLFNKVIMILIVFFLIMITIGIFTLVSTLEEGLSNVASEIRWIN